MGKEVRDMDGGRWWDMEIWREASGCIVRLHGWDTVSSFVCLFYSLLFSQYNYNVFLMFRYIQRIDICMIIH